MAWVRFTSNFDWKPRPQVTLAFLAGQEKNVPRDCAARAVALGKAERMKAPKRAGVGNGGRK